MSGGLPVSRSRLPYRIATLDEAPRISQSCAAPRRFVAVVDADEASYPDGRRSRRSVAAESKESSRRRSLWSWSSRPTAHEQSVTAGSQAQGLTLFSAMGASVRDVLRVAVCCAGRLSLGMRAQHGRDRGLM